jgi:hypothetical protein
MRHHYLSRFSSEHLPAILIRETNAPPLLISFFFRTSSGNLQQRKTKQWNPWLPSGSWTKQEWNPWTKVPRVIGFFYRPSFGNLVPLSNDADLVSHIINFCILNDLLSLSVDGNYWSVDTPTSGRATSSAWPTLGATSLKGGSKIQNFFSFHWNEF